MTKVMLSEISKTYKGSSYAVKDFSLEIMPGEFIVFVGPSGCGKSTTLRMIAGLETITSGSLFIDGAIVNFLEPGQRNLAMVFQNYALYPYMTVYENIAFSLRCAKLARKEIDQNVTTVAKLLQIDHLLKRRPAALSGGQKQRVAIGSALAKQPQLLLMDEPLSNLDARLRTRMRVELAKIHKQSQTTIIYVTHDQVEAMTLADRIVVMKDGIIQQAASPSEIYRHPINRFVASFIGSPTMNFLPVTINTSGQHLIVTYLNICLRIPEPLACRLRNKGYVNKKVLLGIRPEDFHLNGNADCCVRMQIFIIENMGSERLLHGNVGDTSICVKTTGECSYREGQPVQIYPDMNAAKFFDCETEENILYPGVDDEKE